MFGFAFDELAVIVGGSFLTARVLWAIGRVLWCFALDKDYSFQHMLQFEWFVGIAGLLLAVGLLSILTGGLNQAGGGFGLAVVAYAGVGMCGIFTGIMIDLAVELLMYALSVRLRALRVPNYREQLLHGNETVRLDAARRLMSIGRYARPARSELLAVFADSSPQVRFAAARAVSLTIPEPPDDDPDAIREARRLLADTDLGVRVEGAAILAVYREPPDELIPVLSDGLRTGSEDVVDRAIHSLGRLGPAAEPALPLLCDTLYKCIESFKMPVDCRASDVAGNVIEALTRIGASAVPTLIELLERGDAFTKWIAARALGKMGEAARIALPALTRVAIQQSTLASPEAKKAIKRLGGDIK